MFKMNAFNTGGKLATGNYSKGLAKGILSFLFAGTLALNALAQGAKEESKNLGKVSDFYKNVSVSNQRTTHEKSIPALGNDLATIINVDKTEDGTQKVIGSIKGSKASSITFTITAGILEGTAVMPDKHLAYKYFTDANGNVIVKSVDIKEVICIDFDQNPAQKTQRTEAVNAIPPSTSAVYKYQSLPGAVAVAYLDVDGEVVSGTSWAGGATINAQPMNLTEADVTTIWKVVSEDLRAFNINVTTDRAVFNAAPKTRRIMCILTTTNTAAPGAGGVAYINSFSANNDNPCWTFNTGAKTAGETSSHEIGHTLGLAHDGNASTTYYGGHGSWAPIMGSSYGRPIGHWSKGEYAGANNQQDDIAIIAGTRNGFGFRADDAGNTNATAKALTVTTTGSVVAASNYGIITTSTDVDVYSFTTGGGNVSLNVTPFDLYPNLDVLLTLTNAAGAVVATANPTTTMSATLTASLAAGTYYLAVDGTGNGNPLNTGYSDYSSLGGYNVSGTIPVGNTTNISPTVSITAPANNSSVTLPASVVITANAADSDGSVTKVDFYIGATLIGSDNTAPYSFTWSNPSAGTYSVTAKATDNLGAVTTSAAVTVIVNPAPGNIAPVVSITSPSNNTELTAPATITFTVNATDSDGSVTKVEFYNGATLVGSDNTAPYSISWSGVAAGTYNFTAKATDNLGAVTTSAIITVKVNPAPGNIAPVVNITSPANNTELTAPATITLTVNATDSDGSVTKVEFYNGTTLVGSDNTAPYSISWSGVAAGTYNFTAKATDNLGAVTTSAIVTVKVNPVVDICNYPQYIEGGGYNAGDRVKNAGNVYQVRPWPYSGWANGAAWAYAPGTGLYWTDAWVLVGPCSSAAEAAQAAIDAPKTIVVIYNMQGQKVDASYGGLKIIKYSDGSIEKVINK